MTTHTPVPADVDPASMDDLYDDCREVSGVLAPWFAGAVRLPAPRGAMPVEIPVGMADGLADYTFTCAKPPGKCPTRSRDSRTSRVVMPPTFIRFAVSRKNGTASRMNEL